MLRPQGGFVTLFVSPYFAGNIAVSQLLVALLCTVRNNYFIGPLIRCCPPQGPDGAAARLVDGILRRKSFYFQQRSGKLDMRAIGRVDIDSVVKDVDIDILQVLTVTPTPVTF